MMNSSMKFKNNYHLGHLFLDRIKQWHPDNICQIDAATGEQETYRSVLSRSVHLARCFRRLGLQPGDVLSLGGKNHVNLRIPFYAALMNGLPVAGVDPYFKYDEIKSLFKQIEPKIAFCEDETYDVYVKVAKDLKLDVKIVTFNEGECSMSKLMDTCNEESIDEFKPAEYDIEKIYAFLISTSGSTGIPKLTALKHQAVAEPIMQFMHLQSFSDDNSGRHKIGLNVSPVQWLTSFYNAAGYPLVNVCLLQTSKSDNIEHMVDVINKYKPEGVILSPSLMSLILKYKKKCDLTCFNAINLAGSKVFKEIMIDLQARVRKDTMLHDIYGQTEVGTTVTVSHPNGPIGSCGRLIPTFTTRTKLVDPETGMEIMEPHKTGELWVWQPGFTEYYNQPEETALSFSEDGWFKTGDLLYRDENENYYFVERLKMLIKYRNSHIVPTELEEVILTHPSVLEVCVTSVPHRDDGQRPVACVVRRPGCDVTAQEIKDLVAVKLSENKQLRGGVVFLDQLPKTSTGKVARAKAGVLVKTLNME